jgi:hypothetical protein
VDDLFDFGFISEGVTNIEEKIGSLNAGMKEGELSVGNAKQSTNVSLYPSSGCGGEGHGRRLP